MRWVPVTWLVHFDRREAWIGLRWAPGVRRLEIQPLPCLGLKLWFAG